MSDASFIGQGSEAGHAGLDAAYAVRAAEAHPSDYLALLKPRVMSLVVFTGLVGMVLAPGDLHPTLAITALLCIAIGAGASGAINMWYDADIDAVMARTQGRPIPQGRISRDQALGFGTVLSVASVLVMGLAVNWVAAAILALTIGFYIFIYTMWLKRRTPQNIVIGGAAGAFPPMIGWAAVTGDLSLLPLLLFAIIFMWTPPHFWALALYRSDDYARAGVPMLPVVAGDRETRRQILIYSLLLVPITLSPWALGLAGPLYGGVTAALGAIFLALAVRIWRGNDERPAKHMFAYSILYLFLLFALLLAERGLGWGA
ncbi:heme o synthase [Ferrovibrio sp.]|uniref:heme o synthase n=1 Tax=Ferrovibrio sp. TaxID=1917215 RepID=UPI002617AB28|nr:heme o synthase [Ferrovibrio sp.]